MFSSAWFWLVFAAFFFLSMGGVAAQLGVPLPSRHSMLIIVGYIGLAVFLLFGLFFAEKWWQPLCALGISILGGGLLCGVIPEKISAIIGVLGPIIGIVLILAAYFVWY